MDNSKSLPAIWAGMECTISRVGDDFHDQLQCGSYYDKDYLQPVLDLNVSAIRFPVLWEKHEPEQGATIDWTWAREQLGRIRHKGIEPIVGLLHHGSGPAFTSLSDKAMPYYFADYAAKVAQAFPWVNYYTPVNEPLTTARFSGLYGHWYPHKKSDRHFLNMLINQLKATVLGMQAIRAINPAAKLIQTEDLGKTYSCSTLQYQSAFENQRRWLSFDLLCGKVDQKHVLYPYLVRNGVAVSDIEFFVQHPCPPAMIGANYYVTSERYLDCNLDAYPQDTHGGNGIHAYADVEAARVPLTAANGPAVLLTELWERYQIPIAITEVQLHCSREEQLRWFKFIYETAVTLQHSGVDIRAVTAWAVLGSFGWDKLLTCKSMQYESGAFDISAGYCRITALGRLIQEIAQTGASQSYASLLSAAGWWQRPCRFFGHHPDQGQHINTTLQPLLILGKSGTLASAFARVCRSRNIYHIVLGRPEIDICNDLTDILEQYSPWAVINATGYVNVDGAEEDSNSCERINSHAVHQLARACAASNIRLVNFSSDLVFDGHKGQPYVETDGTRPLNVYGKSKGLAEMYLRAVYPGALTIRTSAFFGAWDNYNFIHTTLQSLLNNEKTFAATDMIVSPTYVPHLVNAALDLLIDDECGIWHLANKGAISWYELALLSAAEYKVDTEKLVPISRKQLAAPRPAYAVLGSVKYGLMPSLDKALAAFFSQYKIKETLHQQYETV